MLDPHGLGEGSDHCLDRLNLLSDFQFKFHLMLDEVVDSLDSGCVSEGLIAVLSRIHCPSKARIPRLSLSQTTRFDCQFAVVYLL